jgi:hypothetical protein
VSAVGSVGIGRHQVVAAIAQQCCAAGRGRLSIDIKWPRITSERVGDSLGACANLGRLDVEAETDGGFRHGRGAARSRCNPQVGRGRKQYMLAVRGAV